MINLLLHNNNFYLVISYRRVEKESDELLYTVWSLVMVRKPIIQKLTSRRVNDPDRYDHVLVVD